jgi:raffinose/stachyose/melibiose transport system substrate-binding protein
MRTQIAALLRSHLATRLAMTSILLSSSNFPHSGFKLKKTAFLGTSKSRSVDVLDQTGVGCSWCLRVTLIKEVLDVTSLFSMRPFFLGQALAMFLCVSLVCAEESQKATKPASTIRADLNVYTPGFVPMGFGEPVKVARELADVWETRHPGAKIQFQLQIATGTGEGEWLKTQLLGGIAPEIVHLNAEFAWLETDKGWFVPLDPYLEKPNPYIPGNKRWLDAFRNQAMVGAKRAPDGQLYCIPLDIVETGLFYNKTLLRAHGIEELPKTWVEMEILLATLQDAGLTPMTAPGNLASNWGLDILFEFIYHDILPDLDMVPSRPDAEGYLGHYLDANEAAFLFSKGFFTRRDPRWRETNRLLRQWRGYWAKELKRTDPYRLFLTGKLAFLWESSAFCRRMLTDPYVDFEWGIAYFPPLTQATSPYGSGTPATVIGGAAIQLHVTNSVLLNDNLEECIDFLMYLSAPQNIERMASEALVFIPNVVGAKMDPRLSPFVDIFQRPYCAMKWLESLDGKYKNYWRRMLDFYLNDGVDLEGYLVMLEENFSAWSQRHAGEAAWDFTDMEATWKTREARLIKELDPVR